MTQVELLIDGKSQAAEGGRIFSRMDPVTAHDCKQSCGRDLADSNAAAQAAAAALPEWSATGPSQRRELLLRTVGNAVCAGADAALQASA